MCETWKSHHFLFACTKFVCLLVDDAKIGIFLVTSNNIVSFFDAVLYVIKHVLCNLLIVK